jgi:CheY-like chemotaxis protein
MIIVTAYDAKAALVGREHNNENIDMHATLPPMDHCVTVLIVEDEDQIRKLEEDWLSMVGLSTLTACDGQQGVNLARAHLPDLILLDLKMPDLTGQEVLQALKADPATVDIPVIVVSAFRDSDTVEELYGLGAVKYLKKPFRLQELWGYVRDTLSY